ncbi:MAG: hypothetical protein NTV15_08975 [Candidatus Bathyarchaeota archaeon]|nr:hypothetical protein [Candidatus Bathyarchaeota archaeon]
MEHHKEIFGPECLYFDVKHKLKGRAVAAIPDALAITFNPDRWWIIEIELSTHSIYEHIQNQVGKFIAALPRPNTRHEVISVLWQEINANELVKFNLQKAKGGELFKWLSDLINQQPQLAIIIDKRAPELDDAIAVLTIQSEVIEFATYIREDVGLAEHAHCFEPKFPRIGNQETISIKEPGQKLRRKSAKRRLYVKDGKRYSPMEALEALGAILNKMVEGRGDLRATMADGTILKYVGSTKNGKSKIPKVHAYLLNHGFTFQS